MYLLDSFCFLNIVTPLLRHTYGTIVIRLKMNSSSFKKLDSLPAKFLGH